MSAFIEGLDEKEGGGTLVLFTIAYILFMCMYHTASIYLAYFFSNQRLLGYQVHMYTTIYNRNNYI